MNPPGLLNFNYRKCTTVQFLNKKLFYSMTNNIKIQSLKMKNL